MSLMVPSSIALWWAMPGAEGGLPVGVILALIVILAMGFSCGEVFHNSMLPSIVSPRRLRGLSGLGLAANNAGSMIAFTAVLLTIALPASGVIDWSFLPAQPMFGLDPVLITRKHAAVIAGAWLPIFHLSLRAVDAGSPRDRRERKTLSGRRAEATAAHNQTRTTAIQRGHLPVGAHAVHGRVGGHHCLHRYYVSRAIPLGCRQLDAVRAGTDAVRHCRRVARWLDR